MRTAIHRANARVALVVALGTNASCSGEAPRRSSHVESAPARGGTASTNPFGALVGPSSGGASGGPAATTAGASSGSSGMQVTARGGASSGEPSSSGGSSTGKPSSASGGAADQGGKPSVEAGNAGNAEMPGGADGAGPALPPAAPTDGDPSRPIVAIPGIPCGPHPSVSGLTETNAEVGDRELHVAYPCNKHQGAPVTFVMNLHGTMSTENLKLYQVGYFSIDTLVDSHNLITVAPKSVVSQWGNRDGGKDEPHLMAVIDWVYETFADFDIRAMWVGGHSYGAMYAATFGCKAELADKVKGVIVMSGLPSLPSCGSRIAVIDTVAEDDIAGPMDQKDLPSEHGCSAPQTLKLGNNEQTLWPDCQPGFVHSNYLMLGKGHADFMDPEVVKSIADLIVESRP
jgi:hypothetical protein